MEVAVHIEALQAQGALMTTAAAVADPNGGVPTCPEWRVRDLVRHTGGVHRWATSFVTSGRTEPWHADLDEVVGSWPADDDLAAWLSKGCADLVVALVAAPEDLKCWTFLPAPSPRAMWARRQAHETAIHRVDTEVAVGAAITTFDPTFAADGIDELLQLFVPRRSDKLHVDPPTTVAFRCTDVDAAWLLHLGPNDVRTEPTDVACTVSGTAGDLYLALWNRADAEGLTIEGDRQALRQFSEGVRISWA